MEVGAAEEGAVDGAFVGGDTAHERHNTGHTFPLTNIKRQLLAPSTSQNPGSRAPAHRLEPRGVGPFDGIVEGDSVASDGALECSCTAVGVVGGCVGEVMTGLGASVTFAAQVVPQTAAIPLFAHAPLTNRFVQLIRSKMSGTGSTL
jgi:hypothetical protein